MNKKNRLSTLNIGLALSLALFLIYLIKTLPYISQTFSSKNPAKGPVKVEESSSGWYLTVGGNPYFIKGVCYHYVPVGKGDDYDIFSDLNKPWLVDGALMKKMGVNTVRIYKSGKDKEKTKAFIRDLYTKFGIRTALSHYLGFWDWPPVNYTDSKFREKIKNEIIDMVKAYKDEEGILFWILGNENNYAFDRGVRDWSSPEIDSLPSPLEARKAKAKIYYTFINELAREIKKIDTSHPVVMGNGELASIDIAKEYCPDVDILGDLVYQGKSFGTFFAQVKRRFGKPNVFAEFGADRFNSVWQQETQDWQAFFIQMQWLEISKNMAGGRGEGNSLGGFVFEWCDEWWKHNSEYKPGWSVHDAGGSWSNTAYYFDANAPDNMNEEWWGIVSLDPRHLKGGLEKRVPKKAYYILRSLWTKGSRSSGKVYLIPAILFFILSVIFAVMRTKPNRPG